MNVTPCCAAISAIRGRFGSAAIFPGTIERPEHLQALQARSQGDEDSRMVADALRNA